MRLAADGREAIACGRALRARAVTQFLTARSLIRTGRRMVDAENAAERMTLWT